MAGKGLPPKDPSQRRRRNIDPIPTTVVELDGLMYGPELPEKYFWHEQTLIWWDTWRKSPNAQTFTSTDWDFLLDTALIHTQFWNGENVAAELRLRCAKYGATPEDRLRLRLQIGNKAEPASTVAKTLSGSRKTRLLRVVGGIDGKESPAI